MKIVQVCWYKIFPATHGGQNGIAHFYAAMEKEVEVNLICSNNNDVQKENIFPVLSSSKRQFLQWSNYKKIRNLLNNKFFDIVLIEHPYYAFLYLFRKKYGFKLVVHTHNIEYKRMKLLGKWYSGFVKIIEKLAYRKADFILCKTNEDKIFIQQQFNIQQDKLIIVPYGTKLQQIPIQRKVKQNALRQKYKIDHDSKIILFAASFNYLPNQKALLHLINDIYPLMEKQLDKPFVLILCGIHLEEFIQKESIIITDKMIVAGFVENIDDYFEAADVFLNPVQIGEGVQTKNIDAIAYNCNLVCYENMKTGLPFNFVGEKVFLAKNENQMMEAINTAIQVFQNTSTEFYKNYNWDAIIKNLLLHFNRYRI